MIGKYMFFNGGGSMDQNQSHNIKFAHIFKSDLNDNLLNTDTLKN